MQSRFPGGWIELWMSYSDHTQNGVTLSAWGNNIPFNLDFQPDELNFERFTVIIHKMVLHCLLEDILFHAIYISCQMNQLLNALQRSYTKWRYTVWLSEEYSMQSSFFSVGWIELWTSYSDLTQNGVILSAWGNNIRCNLYFLPDESNFEHFTVIIHKMALHCLLEWIIFHAI
jgi:hypothetical protein